jgi:hypothetical protein
MVEILICEMDVLTALFSLAEQWVGIVYHCWVSMFMSPSLAVVTMETNVCTLL